MITKKYKPTTQKSLFHKDVVNHIRKWIKMIDEYSEYKKSVKQILFLYGPVGCAKTVTIECLFKNYNLIEIDSDNIRSTDKVNEILQLVIGFNEITLANIEKWNHKNKNDKRNIVFIDNIELCEKGIESFIDSIYTKHKIDTPIILVCNTYKYREIFANYKNCTFIEFKKPSLLELTKLSNEINKDYSLNLTKDNIKQLIEKSQYDIRQLLFLLEQWNLGKSNNASINQSFDNFLECIKLKHTDKDLCDKLEYLFNNKTLYNFKEIFQIASSEPQVISNGIYQNYTDINLNMNNFDSQDQLELIKNYSNIIDSISSSNIIHNEIFDNQNWSLYDDYTIYSTMIPSYYLKLNSEIISRNSKNISSENTNTKSNFAPYKDISYNFMNSFEEVKKICVSNIYSKKLNPNFKYTNIINQESCFIFVSMLINSINKLNEYFDKNKRGKNTTKKEKLELCNNITTGDSVKTDDSVKTALDILVNNIYYYKIFEIDIDDFLINKSKYKDDNILKENLNKIDLRVFKRLLNIFTLDDSHKIFKSNVEISIQYKILQCLVEDVSLQPDKIIANINSIENMTINLDEIWNIN